MSNSTGRRRLKKELLATGIAEVCAKCGTGTIWNAEPLTLQIDHINGVWDDDRVENSRLLCPNCHSQTSTFAGRRTRKPTPKCEACDALVSKAGNLCCRCAGKRKAQFKIKWPGNPELKQLVLEHGYLGTGRLLGVSGTSVKKHLLGG